jgi:hypothetical protein
LEASLAASRSSRVAATTKKLSCLI